jgi:CRISPR-associated endonuclease/helicase Cas3
MDFADVFRHATGVEPYPYQVLLATQIDPPGALVAPTGAGKTAAIVLAWVWRRRFAGAETRRGTPRRLVVCLPMRTLVTQTLDAVTTWLRLLGLLANGPAVRENAIAVHALMGGIEDEAWLLDPERDAVLIGTQDMLLSRALNRGYGASRFAWPWHFGLLSNDCWWVFDEVQLMGVGLTTGIQLQAFRDQFCTFGPTRSLFMSATLAPSWLVTVDHPTPVRVLQLSSADLATPALARRRTASKRLVRAATTVGKDSAKGLAREVLRRHRPGTRTVVVLNTVARALALHDALNAAAKDRVSVVLVHSRFRPADREAALRRALEPAFDGIVVSTQVIEAGVDVSSQTLFTELAPWPSLVQRAGRCNRAGEFPSADVFWIDHDDLDETAAPYATSELAYAREHLRRLRSFNPAAIEAAGVQLQPSAPSRVVRRRDVVDLFDTTPDLAGRDVDVSQFIRDGDDRDVQVFWRVLIAAPTPEEAQPLRAELCSVPFHELRAWAEGGREVWRWNALEGEWKRARSTDIYPGGTFLLPAAAGGYLSDRGWQPASVAPVEPVGVAGDAEPPESLDADPLSIQAGWVPLSEHLIAVKQEAERLVTALGLDARVGGAVVRASQLHDVGKAHGVFQQTIRAHHPGDSGDVQWAKCGIPSRHARPGFRHELAGALACLGSTGAGDGDLVAYLIAAHHGKVRLSIRSMPHDVPAPEAGRLFARGVWDGEELPPVDCGEGLTFPATVLNLTFMLLGRASGRPSWIERAVGLRDALGPFRLAYLEALVRAADVRVSMGGVPR